jgi:hypothetical protein
MVTVNRYGGGEARGESGERFLLKVVPVPILSIYGRG